MLSLDTAQISLIGNREGNQDRAEVFIADDSLLAVVTDGMGGHTQGDLAAEVAISCLNNAFREVQHRPSDPRTFLRKVLQRAQDEVFVLGKGMPAELRPGTMIACALIHREILYWAHVGDSRTYHLRGGKLLMRTRDHTVVESLIEAGQLTIDEALSHPDRHLVEYCLGVDAQLPIRIVGGPQPLVSDDTVLLCSDGFWGQLPEPEILSTLRSPNDLEGALRQLASKAVCRGNGTSDNVTAIAIRAVEEL